MKKVKARKLLKKGARASKRALRVGANKVYKT